MKILAGQYSFEKKNPTNKKYLFTKFNWYKAKSMERSKGIKLTNNDLRKKERLKKYPWCCG